MFSLWLLALLLLLLDVPKECRAFLSISSTRERQFFRVFLGKAPPPVNEGTVTVTRPDGLQDNDKNCDNNNNKSSRQFSLAYRVVRPMSLSSRQKAPIVILHGGPSVPSDYLYPLQDVIPYRSLVFYDQLGCGRSDEPLEQDCYSIEYAVNDLEALIQHLGVRRFHLYGQSFGGILAFEYMKRIAEKRGAADNNKDDTYPTILSAILSSSPTNVSLVELEAQELLKNLEQSSSPSSETTPVPDSDLMELFRKRHQCRTDQIPQPLADAYSHAGTVWRGSNAISEYVATPSSTHAVRMPSCLILRGEHDFCTPTCVQDWPSLFNHNFVRMKTLAETSHHGLLEQPALYGDILESYVSEYD